ncbi:Purine-cytosine permease fcy21 [Saitoella coloradoensis]
MSKAQSNVAMTDLEKNPYTTYDPDGQYATASLDTDTAAETTTTSLPAPLQKLHHLAQKFDIETRGIEPVPENLRTQASLWSAGSMWLAANLVISTFTIGTLGSAIFGCGFWDSIATIIFFNMLGIIPVAYFSTFGAKMGMRQMVITRYSFGYVGAWGISLLNVIACVGWSATNVIVGAQLIKAVNSSFPLWAGIVIITLATVAITTFGYKVVHVYEKWSWIPAFVIFLIMIAEIARSGAFHVTPMPTGATEAASVLSFGGTIYGFATGWTSYAADYTTYQPRTISSPKVFASVYISLLFPLCFVQFIGAAAITMIDTPAYGDAYTTNSIGGLVGAILAPLGGFGSFCLVVMALSIIANNCPNQYSFGLSVQTWGGWFQRIPRFIWNVLGAGIIIAIAIPGSTRFTTVLENFLNLIAYWLAIYFVIVLEEHLIFRRGQFSNYDLSAWNSPSKLPVGVAAVGAFCVGVAGFVIGMDQVWFVGPVGKGIGAFGGDVGFELAAAFAGVTYPVARMVERRYFAR